MFKSKRIKNKLYFQQVVTTQSKKVSCGSEIASCNNEIYKSQGETLQERRKSFAATFEAMTLENNDQVSVDNIENENDEVMEVRPNEQNFNKMRRGSKFQRGKVCRQKKRTILYLYSKV